MWNSTVVLQYLANLNENFTLFHIVLWVCFLYNLRSRVVVREVKATQKLVTPWLEKAFSSLEKSISHIIGSSCPIDYIVMLGLFKGLPRYFGVSLLDPNIFRQRMQSWVSGDSWVLHYSILFRSHSKYSMWSKHDFKETSEDLKNVLFMWRKQESTNVTCTY